jgi:hypothetical protein
MNEVRGLPAELSERSSLRDEAEPNIGGTFLDVGDRHMRDESAHPPPQPDFLHPMGVGTRRLVRVGGGLGRLIGDGVLAVSA